MKGFLYQVAERLHREYGEDVSSLRILFPSRRAQLFFSDALSQVTSKPLWQPVYQTIDDVIGELSDLKPSDHVRLMTELYKAYSEFHEESFDSFYFWGEMLLADFDTIDKYMVDARMLFSNLNDLKQMEGDQSYLSPEQIEIISRFWSSFGRENFLSEEQQRFLSIWSTLFDVYSNFRRRLTAAGMSYGGMIYRDVAEMIKTGQFPSNEKYHYVIAGFNALSECEKVLFGYLSKEHYVDFFWDYDRYYTDDTQQEAGLFLRDNIKRFPQRLALEYDYKEFSKPKNIRVVSAPSDSLQCKYAGTFLAETDDSGMRLYGKETAIVLTDENLLIPLLHSIPESIPAINVTMGYPLRSTPAYSFTERLLELQRRKRISATSEVSFYHSDVLGLLNHPYVAYLSDGTSELSLSVTQAQSIYISAGSIAREGLNEIFRLADDDWKGLADYLVTVLGRVMNAMVSSDGDRQSLDFLTLIAENIIKLSNSLSGCGVEVSEKIFSSLLRKILQNVRIPFEGEPLEGVQVMGILETRNLDFENVLLLSANDDTFPGNRAVSSSFIPNNLRVAYGIPTPTHHEGVYAYYFYRLLQRAHNVHIAYSSKADMKSNGEQSRYIYQLKYESPHKLREINIGLEVGLEPNEAICIDKTDAIYEELLRFSQKKGRKLSPTSFYNFVACPLKFYFHSIARLDPAEEIAEEIDSPILGSILHFAMKCLYEPLVGMMDPRPRIAALIGSDKVEKAVEMGVDEEVFKGKHVPAEDYSGNLLMIRDIVLAYINYCLLPFDASRTERFEILGLESPVESLVAFAKGEVVFGGTVDRVDRTEHGMLRVVDYKTGREQLEFAGFEALFSGKPEHLNSAVLQTLLYSMILHSRNGNDVAPELYFVRNMNRPDYSPMPQDKGVGMSISSYITVKERFEEFLKDSIDKLFDKEQPFSQCEDPKTCKWCDFNVICRR